MRNIFLLTAFYGLSLTGFGQIIPTMKVSSPAGDYLKKSKKQKIAAWTCTGGGALLIFISSRMVTTAIRNDNYYSNQFLPSTLKLAGAFSLIGSIPLFIASARNKGKAMGTGLKIKMEPVIGQAKNILHLRGVTSISYYLQL